MSENAKILAGDSVPLNLQTTDGNTALFPRAYIVDQDGNPTTPSFVDLEHVANGKYLNPDNDFAMPNVEQLHVTYVQFEDSDRTILSEYSNGSDIFERESLLPSQLPSADAITANLGDDPSIKAQLFNGGVTAEMTTDEIKAKITSEEEVQATSDDAEIGASLDSDEINANLGCKE